MDGTKTDRLLMLALIVVLLANAVIGYFVAYEAHESRMHSSENNCILRGIAETSPGPERAGLVARCRAGR